MHETEKKKKNVGDWEYDQCEDSNKKVAMQILCEIEWVQT